MGFIGNILIFILQVYFWVIIVSVVASWLIAFEVINTRNPQAANLMRLLEKLTEPVYRPLRKFIPAIGGIDITPIIILFALQLLQNAIFKIFVLGYVAP